MQRRRRRRAESFLNYELRFESLLSSLSATFANVQADRTNAEIEKALEKLRGFLDLDRVSLFKTIEPGGPFGLSHSASGAAIPPSPRSFSRDEFPWLVANLLQGNDCVIRSREDLPPDAQKEQIFLLEKDYKFVAIVPLRAARQTVGSLVFISFHEGTWPDQVIRQFRVLAEVFANTLVRKRIEDGLQESQQRFQTMADTAPVMIWISGTDKSRTFFNRQWLDFTGRTPGSGTRKRLVKERAPGRLGAMPANLYLQFRRSPIIHYGIPPETAEWRVWLGFRHRRAEIYAGGRIHRFYRILHGYHRPEIRRAEPSRP